jgi:hypothetical protein
MNLQSPFVFIIYTAKPHAHRSTCLYTTRASMRRLLQHGDWECSSGQRHCSDETDEETCCPSSGNIRAGHLDKLSKTQSLSGSKYGMNRDEYPDVASWSIAYRRERQSRGARHQKGCMIVKCATCAQVLKNVFREIDEKSNKSITMEDLEALLAKKYCFFPGMVRC